MYKCKATEEPLSFGSPPYLPLFSVCQMLLYFFGGSQNMFFYFFLLVCQLFVRRSHCDAQDTTLPRQKQTPAMHKTLHCHKGGQLLPRARHQTATWETNTCHIKLRLCKWKNKHRNITNNKLNM